MGAHRRARRRARLPSLPRVCVPSGGGEGGAPAAQRPAWGPHKGGSRCAAHGAPFWPSTTQERWGAKRPQPLPELPPPLCFVVSMPIALAPFVFSASFYAADGLPSSNMCCTCFMACCNSAFVRCLVQTSEGLSLFLIVTMVRAFA